MYFTAPFTAKYLLGLGFPDAEYFLVSFCRKYCIAFSGDIFLLYVISVLVHYIVAVIVASPVLSTCS